MPNNHRNRALKITFFPFFLCLLLLNLGAGGLPVPVLQDSETLTPAYTQEAVPFDTPDPETVTPTDAPPESTPTEPMPTGENTAADSNYGPLPAAFAAGTYAQDELVVRFKSSTSPARVDECFREVDVQVQAEIEQLQTFILSGESGEMASTFYRVLDCAGVLYVEPNFLLQAADTIPNDPDWGIQYGLTNIRAPQGWDLSTGSSAVTIAIVDTGVDYGHPDLAAKLVGGYDFVNNDGNPQDDHGHGTHVAGIAAATSNNGTGISGVSWGARIMPVKVLNAKGGGTYADTAAGVTWAVDHGAQVINLSLGGTEASAILTDAIHYAQSKGALVVAAAGNTSSNFVLFPARVPLVVAVGKTNSTNHWDGSNFGPEIDLSAPGASIYSTVIGGYDYNSGSSMSTGFVSGLASILFGIPGNASPDRIESQMESTALDIEFTGWDAYTGAGLIQMDAAIQLALQSVHPDDEFDAGAPSIGSGPSSGQIALTNTPPPTLTVSLTLPLQETTLSTTPEPTFTNSALETSTSIPTDKAREVEAQEGPGINIYVLPCTGILLILAGILLLWMFSRKKQES